MESAKILIVDDSEDLRMLLADRLLLDGFQVLQAKDGLEGLDVAQQERPHLIILDLMMPAMSGEQMWRNLRNNPDLKDIPVLILTAKRQYQDRYWGKSMPSEDFFTKPYKADVLIKRIRQKLAAVQATTPSNPS